MVNRHRIASTKSVGRIIESVKPIERFSHASFGGDDLTLCIVNRAAALTRGHQFTADLN